MGVQESALGQNKFGHKFKIVATLLSSFKFVVLVSEG